MKSYTITVNGTVYDVTVEEKAGGAAAPAAPAQAAAPAPAPAQAPAPKAPAASGSAGSVEVTASPPAASTCPFHGIVTIVGSGA